MAATRPRSEMPRMVRSKDGTPLAIYDQGAGPSLLLVHGGSGDHTRWGPVLPALSADFHVCAMDRRGHGLSGAGYGEYSLEKEFADVEIVADAVDRPVSVIGHSFGAICAAEAALLTRSIGQLVLYEPPFPVNGPVASPETVAELDDLLREGRNDEALEVFLRNIVKLPDSRIAAARAEPDWAARASTMKIQIREIRGLNAYRFEPGRFANLRIPVLLVMGSETAEHHRAAINALRRALPNRTVITLPGQGHDAVQAAPAVFKDAVMGFLKSHVGAVRSPR
jgi:pimeloyl-ACP methyl ester carboxylesterase